MKNKGMLILTCVVILLPALMGVILWNDLPAQMPIHFNIHGEADNWAGKPFAVFGFPLFLLVLQLLCVWATGKDPKRKNVDKTTQGIVLWICPIISLLIGCIVFVYSMGGKLDLCLLFSIVFGILFIIFGNYLPKSRQNYTMGIKLPWTLRDADNWNYTHRVSGRLWIVCGIVLLVTAPFHLFWVLFAVIAVVALGPVFISWRYAKTHNN